MRLDFPPAMSSPVSGAVEQHGAAPSSHRRRAARSRPGGSARHASHTTRPTVTPSASRCTPSGSPSNRTRSPTTGAIAPSRHEPDQLLVGGPHPGGVDLGVEPPVEAEDRVVLHQGVAEGWRGHRPAREPHHDDPALEGDALRRLGVGVTTDRVEHDVRSASAGHRLDHRHDVLGMPVDDHVRTAPPRHLGLVGTADDRDDPGSRSLAQLHGGRPDPPAAACTSRVSPGCRRARSWRANQPVW